MRCLLIDVEGMFLDLALRCIDAGHDVRLYQYSTKPTKDGRGFKGLKIIDDWRTSMPWAKDGLIITSGNWKHLAELDRYREHGYKIFAPTVKSAALEINRSLGMESMKAAGIDIPPYHQFNSLAEAEAFQRKSDQAYVFKTMGDNEDKSLSFVAKDPSEMVGWIRQKMARGLNLKGPCMLQEKIDMLAEIGVSGWFGPEGFLPRKFQMCAEHKKLMNGEIGPNTGEQGTLTQYVEMDKIVTDGLLPMEPILKVLGHRGDFSLGAGIDKKGKVWPFEWTSRCGWPAFFIQTASHKGDPAQWMRDLLDGKDTLKVSYDAAIGVVMAQPMYPYNKSTPEMVEGNPISIDPDIEDQIHFASVMIGKGPKMEGGKIVERPIYQTTGEYVAVATGLGKSIGKARDSVYEAVEGVQFPNMMYRTDIGEKIQKILPELHRLGYWKDLSA